MALKQEDLSKFREQRERLGGMLSDASEIIRELNMASAGQNLADLGKKVNDDTFKIQVIGTFKNGKSTFINSLLGEYVLPAYSLPCTAVINEVKYGTEKKAVLYFRNPLPEKLPESISPKALEHMKKHNMQNVPPMDIPYTDIEEYVTIPMGMDAKEMLLESPYEKVDLFWPLPMLKEGVEIIDSPGLNEAQTRTRVTMDYLSKADAILFVLNAQALCGMTEMNFIENTLNASGFNDIFFIVNRFDCIPEREREALKKFTHLKVDQYTTNDVYFVSAQQALDSALNNDDKLYEQSGMRALTERLSSYLTKDKGKVKLSQPARELKRIVNNEALYKIIPAQRLMLETSINDLKVRYDQTKPELDNLKAKKQQIVDKINLKIEQSKHEFRRSVYRNSMKIAEMIPVWVEEFTPNKEIGGFIKPNEKDVNDVVQEIAAHIQSKVEDQQNTWKKEVLMPLSEEKAQYIFGSVETDISRLLNEIDSVRIKLTGGECGTQEVDDISIWERLGGAVAGFLGGGLGGAVSGGVNGLSKALVQSIAVNIGGAILLGILGLFNPFTAIALMAATIFTGMISRGDKVLKEIKAKVSEELVKQLSSNAEDDSDKIAGIIAGKYAEVNKGLSDAIDIEINQLSEQVQGIIEEMEKGKANADARKKIISSCETKLKALSSDLDAFTFELIDEK